MTYDDRIVRSTYTVRDSDGKEVTFELDGNCLLTKEDLDEDDWEVVYAPIKDDEKGTA
jgi:hypothetical protein